MCVCAGVSQCMYKAVADRIPCSQCVSLAVKVIVAAATADSCQSNLPSYKSLPPLDTNSCLSPKLSSSLCRSAASSLNMSRQADRQDG